MNALNNDSVVGLVMLAVVSLLYIILYVVV